MGFYLRTAEASSLTSLTVLSQYLEVLGKWPRGHDPSSKAVVSQDVTRRGVFVREKPPACQKLCQ